MGDSPKWVKSRRRREKERLNDGNNNGQATHGARKHAWRTQAAWANLRTKCHDDAKERFVKTNDLQEKIEDSSDSETQFEKENFQTRCCG